MLVPEEAALVEGMFLRASLASLLHELGGNCLSNWGTSRGTKERYIVEEAG